MEKRSYPLAAFATGMALVLAGCSGAAGLSALDRPAVPGDALPGYVEYPDGVDRATNRLLVEHGGLQYFAAQNEDRTSACLAVVEAGAQPAGTETAGTDEWMAGCFGPSGSGSYAVMFSAPLDISVHFASDGSDPQPLEADGWTRLHENVFIKD